MASYKLIGQNYTTTDLRAKVTGQAKYAEDFRAEGMVFMKLLLSPMPHARVRRLDADAALAHLDLTADGYLRLNPDQYVFMNDNDDNADDCCCASPSVRASSI